MKTKQERKSEALKEYETITDAAHEAIFDPAWKAYAAITDPAREAYLAKCKEIDNSN